MSRREREYRRRARQARQAHQARKTACMPPPRAKSLWWIEQERLRLRRHQFPPGFIPMDALGAMLGITPSRLTKPMTIEDYPALRLIMPRSRP